MSLRSGETSDHCPMILTSDNVPRRQCPEVFVIRKTLTQMAEEASLTPDKRLMVDGVEVAVIYMR